MRMPRARARQFTSRHFAGGLFAFAAAAAQHGGMTRCARVRVHCSPAENDMTE